jgi:hypothetical protein
MAGHVQNLKNRLLFQKPFSQNDNYKIEWKLEKKVLGNAHELPLEMAFQHLHGGSPPKLS